MWKFFDLGDDQPHRFHHHDEYFFQREEFSPYGA